MGNTILISVCVVMIMGCVTVAKGGTPFLVFLKPMPEASLNAVQIQLLLLFVLVLSLESVIFLQFQG